MPDVAKSLSEKSINHQRARPTRGFTIVKVHVDHQSCWNQGRVCPSCAYSHSRDTHHIDFAFRFAPSEGKLAASASWKRFDLPRMRKGDDPKTNARGGNRVYNLLGDFTDTRARAETDELTS